MLCMVIRTPNGVQDMETRHEEILDQEAVVTTLEQSVSRRFWRLETLVVRPSKNVEREWPLSEVIFGNN